MICSSVFPPPCELRYGMITQPPFATVLLCCTLHSAKCFFTVVTLALLKAVNHKAYFSCTLISMKLYITATLHAFLIREGEVLDRWCILSLLDGPNGKYSGQGVQRNKKTAHAVVMYLVMLVCVLYLTPCAHILFSWVSYTAYNGYVYVCPLTPRNCVPHLPRRPLL